jgi:hypothetical protein
VADRDNILSQIKQFFEDVIICSTYIETLMNLHLSTTGNREVHISKQDGAPTPFSNFVVAGQGDFGLFHISTDLMSTDFLGGGYI